MESNTKKASVNFSSPLGDQPATRKYVGSKGWPRVTDNFAVIGTILQQPAHFFQEIREGIGLGEKIGALLTSSIILLTVYGAVLGSGHPLLSLNAALAVPFLILGSLATCIPVMYLLDVLSGSQRSLSQMVAVLFSSMSAAATILFSFAPIMIVFRLTGTLAQYFWLNLGVLAMATLVGLLYVTQGLIQTAIVDQSHTLSQINRRLHFLWMLVFLMVISQMTWGMLSFFQLGGGFSGLLF